MPSEHTPTRTDIENDTYALVIHEGGQDLYQYEKPTPWEDPEWIEKRRYDHGNVPPLNLEQTQFEQQTNDGRLQKVTLYASELDANTEHTNTESTNEQSAGDNTLRGYVIRFSDGQMIPDQNQTTHNTQEKNMGAAIDYLVREYDLINEINLPYLPSWAHQNCSINTEPVHPEGEQMRGEYELTGGYYLYTALNKQSKKDRIKDLTEKVNMSVEFMGNW